jgi:hypothetical protein
MRRAYNTMVEMSNTHSTLIGKPRRKRPLGRLRSGWEYNIKTDPANMRLWTRFTGTG